MRDKFYHNQEGSHHTLIVRVFNYWFMDSQACLANGCNCGIFVWKVVKSDWCDIKYKKNLELFYRKVKKFCYVVDFFIWIIIINYWCDIKSEK
jgi:hypothetical protein